MGCGPEERKLYGMPKWEVENAADTLRKASEMEASEPKLYAAALKLTARRESALGAILRAAASKRKS